MFDIYRYADEYDADYMDNSFNTYKVQDYNKARKNGFPTPGIAVYNLEGKLLGYAQKIQEEN